VHAPWLPALRLLPPPAAAAAAAVWGVGQRAGWHQGACTAADPVAAAL